MDDATTSAGLFVAERFDVATVGKGDPEWLAYWGEMRIRVVSVGGPHVDLS